MATDEQKTLGDNYTSAVTSAVSIKVAFPECTDLLLSQVWDTAATVNPADSSINAIYKEYFSHSKHESTTSSDDHKKLKCGPDQTNPTRKISESSCGCCIPDSCHSLNGIRGSIQWATSVIGLKRLFIADLVWVHWFEAFGVFKIFAKIIEDYAYNGQYPLNSKIIVTEEGLNSLIMEMITREMKCGLATSIKDRVSTYRRSLGWSTDLGSKIEMKTTINNSFNKHFHSFIKSALDYYQQLRLAEAIQNTTMGKASISTLVEIENSITLLQKSFSPFLYGRNYNNTLSSIVYIITSLYLIKTFKQNLGISSDELAYYASATYEILMEGKSLADTKADRFELYSDLAINGRDILLDIESVNSSNIKVWIENDETEKRVEAYRTAYQKLYGIDLSKQTGLVPQQA